MEAAVQEVIGDDGHGGSTTGTPGEENAEQLIDRAVMETLAFDTDHEVSGVKDGLPASSRRKKRQQLHEDCCHVGYMPDCVVCKTTKVSLRRIQNKVDPYIDTRPCARFHCDTGTVDCKTCDGERYFTVMREEGADYMECFLSKYKSDIVKGIDRIITWRRNQPMFSQYKGYKFCSYLKLDPDALWREDAAEFKEVCERHGITVEYCDKNDHRTHGRAENAVRQMEMGIKCAMAQTGLPRWMWGYCAINTRNCKNWFPTRQAVKSQDGDAARPLEKATLGVISRRMIDKRINHQMACGTLCFCVEIKVKASSISNPMGRWGIFL